ncbi:MAG: hypothetical protein KF817_15050 [Phycisphaeraceae bacterium]|nr:hypothetical protein [Phycisphaeraceae bacterium]
MPRTRRRSIFRILFFLVVLVVFAIVLAPTAIGLFIARGMIERAAGDALGAPVRIGSVRLGWTGHQAIEGFRVTAPDGSEAMRADLRVDAGLFSLLVARPSTLRVHLTGAARGELLEDGRVILPGAPTPAPRPPAAPEPAAPGVPGVPGPPGELIPRNLPALDVAIDGLDLDLAMRGTGSASSTLRLRDLRGAIAVESSGAGTAVGELRSASGADMTDLAVELSARNFIDPGTRRMVLRGASGDFQLRAGAVTVPPGATVRSIESLRIHVRTSDAFERIDLDVDLRSAVGDGPDPVGLQGTIVARRPAEIVAAPLMALPLIDVDLVARALPVSLLQPFLAATPLLLAQDLGPMIDARMRVEGGAASLVDVELKADRLQFTGGGRVSSRGDLETGAIDLVWTPEPARVTALAGVDVPGPVIVRVRGTDLDVPFAPGDPAVIMQAASGVIAIDVEGTVGVPVAARGADEPGGRPPDGATGAGTASEAVLSATETLPVRDLTMQASRAAGDATVHVTMGMLVDGVRAEVDQRVRIPEVLPDTAFGLARLTAGLVRVDGAPEAALRRWIERAAGDAVPREVIDGRWSMELRSGPTEDAGAAPATPRWNAALTLTGPRVQVESQGGLGTDTPDAWDLATTVIRVQVTPELLAPFLPAGAGSDAGAVALNGAVDRAAAVSTGTPPVVLRRPTGFVVQVDPIRGRGVPTLHTLLESPLRASFTAERTAFGVAGLREDLRMESFRGEVRARRGDGDRVDAEVEARFAARVDRGGALIGRVAADARVQDLLGAAPPRWTADLGLNEIAVVIVEQVLGRPAGSIADLLGATGALTVHAAADAPDGDAIALEARPAFPQVTGRFPLTVSQDTVGIRGAESVVRLPAAVLDRWMSESPSSSGGAAPADRLTVTGDLAVALAVREVTMPLAMLRGEAFAPGEVRIDVDGAAEPLPWRMPDGTRLALSGGSVRARATDLSGGVTVVIDGEVREGDATVGRLSVDGLLRDLIGDNGVFTPQRVAFTGRASAAGIPTRVLDRMLRQDGMLVAAVGETMTGTIDAMRFSATFEVGHADLDITSPAARLKARVMGREKMIRIPVEQPIDGTMEATPELRQRLLQRIHPIFADIRAVDQPITVRSTEVLRIPIDGNPAGLNGALRLTVGAIAIDSGSSLLSVFSLFNRSDRVATLRGSIDPVDVRIRNGVVSYDRFAMKIDQVTIVYSGQIDLVKQQANLRFEVPLSVLAHSFRELEGFAERITVPVVTRGPLDRLKTELDPDFDIGKAALEAGFRGGLDSLLRGRLRGLFDRPGQ